MSPIEANVGTASRFYPTFHFDAKAPPSERRWGKGACVKPQALLRWLARLAFAPKHLILAPYAGTGSEMVALLAERMRVIGCDSDPAQFAIAQRRLAEVARA